MYNRRQLVTRFCKFNLQILHDSDALCVFTSHHTINYHCNSMGFRAGAAPELCHLDNDVVIINIYTLLYIYTRYSIILGV